MVRWKENKHFLIIAFIMLIWLSVAQILDSQILLVPCLILFVAFVAWSVFKNMAIPVLLLFLPWAALLKFDPEKISFYTVALLGALILALIRNRLKIRAYHFLPPMALLVITLIAKFYYGYSMDNSYVLFFVFLFCVPLLWEEVKEQCDFYSLTMFFSLGIISAALSAPQLISFSNIAQYIGNIDYQGLTRYSGYYGDPNFYAAHITAALAGVFVLILKDTHKRSKIFLYILAVLLAYCGLLSASKSFYVVFAAIFAIFLWHTVFARRKASLTSFIVFGVVIAGTLILSLTLFSDLINTMLLRFSSGKDISSLTTGRYDIWKNYFHGITTDLELLLMGKGYTNVYLGDKSPHNTVIQTVYQFGIFGTTAFIIWIVCYWKGMLQSAKLTPKIFSSAALLLIGAFTPWLALDLLFFDEFFLMQLYVCGGISWLVSQSEQEQAQCESC